MKLRLIAAVLIAAASFNSARAQDFVLTESGYFRNHGVDAMAFLQVGYILHLQTE